MKIIIERRYFKKDYTIGSLTIEGTSFKCDTLEPRDRRLMRMEDESFDVFSERVRRVKASHPTLPTAIPYGTYWTHMRMSTKCRGFRPMLCGVAGFLGVFIHEGNTPGDTKGCILVGENRERGKVLNSRATLRFLMDYIYKAEEVGEPVEVEIKSLTRPSPNG